MIFSDENIKNIFGNEDAENENPDRLKEYFFRNKAYDSLIADLPIRIIVGHKGVGKSALLKICHLEDQEKDYLTLWVRPNDVFSSVDSEAKNFLNLIENWKIGLSTLILRKALEGADLYDEASKIEKITGGIRQAISILSEKYRAVLPGHQTNKLIGTFLKTKKIRVYLDDLDRGWEARPEDIKNISALLNAVRDLAGENPNVQFRIGLRTDVYHLVRSSDESTDKIESNLILLSWSNHEILTAMAKRIGTYFGENVDEYELIKKQQLEISKYLHRIITERFLHVGKWDNAPIHRILLSLTRKRPRDLVKLLVYAGKEAYRDGNKIITTENLRRVFEKYSNERMRDVINEFKTELPNVEAVVFGMRQTNKERASGIGPVFTQDQLVVKMKSIIQSNNITFRNGIRPTPQELANFLFKIDFITARLDTPNKVIRKHFEENQTLQTRHADFGFSWEIHPAYRWALEPQSIDNLLNRIDLSDSDTPVSKS